MVATIHYMHMIMALYVRLTKEIGLRKTLDAKCYHPLLFMSQTFLVTLFAVLLALLIVELMLSSSMR